ncbi:MAG: ATP-binding protein [Paludibacteraceae bacterium]|nr:ATP-binding protein [Paludibacteraceae bacterium]
MTSKNYYPRKIDGELSSWAKSDNHKPLLLRGARQVGKSSAVRHLAEQFKYFIEINLERNQLAKNLFRDNLDVKQICEELTNAFNIPVVAGETLIFIDEIQESGNAIRSLRYFYEDMPNVHVIAAGSLLEFTLAELPSFGVGRIRSMFMYPFSFYEFLGVVGSSRLQNLISSKKDYEPLSDLVHEQLLQHYRTFLLTGGMPEVVATWADTHKFSACSAVQNDIMLNYQVDFAKYKSRISPLLLQQTLLSVARQAGQKFVFSEVSADIPKVKEALSLLTMAGLIVPATHSAANGLPLGAQLNEKFRKFVLIDTGLMLNLLGLSMESLVLLPSSDLANKGSLAEVYVGTELLKSQSPYIQAGLYYWLNLKKGGQAEIDYLIQKDDRLIPVEVKSGKQGSMKSLYYFLGLKQLPFGIRTSIENYGSLEHVRIVPLYSIGCL